MRGIVLAGVVSTLLLAACGDEFPATPPQSALPLDSGDLEPGPIVHGLCVHARVDAKRGLIRYRVENFGEAPFTYLERHVEALLEVRHVDENVAHQLALRPEALRFYSGMGPMPRDVRRLAPEAFMPREAQHTYVDQRRFTNQGTPRPGLEVPPAEEEFLLDLLDHVWPEALGSLDEGELALRVVQVHGDWSELPGLEGITGITGCRVASAWLPLDLGDVPPVVRASFDRGAE